MNPGDFPPDDFTWADLVGNREMVRDVLRFVEQMKALEVLVACEKRVLKLSEHADNMVLDLRVELPAAPVLTVTEADPVLSLSWVFEETGYTGVYVERSLDGITFTPLANLAGDATSYDDADVVAGTEYCYRVRGRRCGIHSEWSNIDCGMLEEEEPPAEGFFLHAWGPNNNGGLGTGDTSPRDEPTAIGASAEWAKMAIGLNHAIGIKGDGTLWSTGSDSNGQLGRGGAGDVSTFAQIGTDTDWADCACGELHSMAIKTDGTLWGWGYNANGQLGFNDGLFTDANVPTQVESATDWAMVACGNIHTLAIKTTGTLWTCGNNLRGQLGTGAAPLDFDAFAQVGSATWTTVSGGGEHSNGVQTGGTLWSWGRNTNGALGLGDTTARTTPVQVGALTTWSKCSGGERFSAASRTDGTLWTSGANSQGQLGQGDTTQRTSFTQVGVGTDWDYPACGDDFCIAIKTTGELFAWGSNGNGQLGLNDTTQRQSPVQIGSGTDWVAVVIGDEFVMALTDA